MPMQTEEKSYGWEKFKHVALSVGKTALKGLMWGAAIAAACYFINPFAWLGGIGETVDGWFGGSLGTGLLDTIAKSGFLAKGAMVGAAFGLADGLQTIYSVVDAESLRARNKQASAMRQAAIDQQIQRNRGLVVENQALSHGLVAGRGASPQLAPGM